MDKGKVEQIIPNKPLYNNLPITRKHKPLFSGGIMCCAHPYNRRVNLFRLF